MVLFVNLCLRVSVFLAICILKYNCHVQEGDALKRLHCSLGLDRDKDCPVDGGWSAWKAWQKCLGECGQIGHRTRIRVCNSPPPFHGGSFCHGPNSETESCVLPGCNADEYRQMVAGEPLRAGQFQAIQAVHERYPALSEKCLTNDCRYQTVKQVLEDNAMQYWNALHCVKHHVGCPVRGGWAQWSSWSPCSAICGLGSRYRRRNCTNPAPSTPELACSGKNFDTQECTGISCSMQQDGVWSIWFAWSDCNVPCGPGIRRRQRECLKKLDKRADKEVDLLMDNAWPGNTVYRRTRVLDDSNMCSGPNQEVEQCQKKGCSVDGGWSVWESWSPCSADCGLGAQSRSRACSSPPPQGSGLLCSGLVTEVRHCFERPCTVKTHLVAVLRGDGALLYSATGRPSRLLQMYLRFLPLIPFGILVHRYEDNCMGLGCDYVSLALEGGFLVLSALVSGCSVTSVSQSKLLIGEWHSILFTVTGFVATLRVDDSSERSESRFNCEPVMPELDQAMRVGERFRGQIQQIAVNYSPVRLRREVGQGSESHQTGAAPYASSNVAYEVADKEEGFVKLVGREMIQIPCPANSDHWEVELAVKPDKADGLLLYLPGNDPGDYTLATLESGHVKLSYRFGEKHSEAESPVEIFPGKWLHLLLNRVLRDEDQSGGDIGMLVNGDVRVALPSTSVDNYTQIHLACRGNIIIGDITGEIETQLKKQSPGIMLEALTGILGYLALDRTPEDFESLPMVQDSGVTFSSRTASFADNYEEVPVLLGQQLNLTCVYNTGHKRSSKGRHVSKKATWLHLDIPVKMEASGAAFTVKDDGYLTTLRAASYPTRDAIEGFFSCWVRRSSGGMGRVLVAFGVTVVDPAVEFNTIPVEAVHAVGFCAVLVCILYVISLVVQAFLDKDEKMGLYQSVIRTIRGQKLSTEDKIQNMLRMIRSPQGRLILGSDEAVLESEEKLMRTMRLQGGEDVFRSSESSSYSSYSEPDIQPAPVSRVRRVTQCYSKSHAFSKFNSAPPTLHPKSMGAKGIIKKAKSNLIMRQIGKNLSSIELNSAPEKMSLNLAAPQISIQESTIEINSAGPVETTCNECKMNSSETQHPAKKVQSYISNASNAQTISIQEDHSKLNYNIDDASDTKFDSQSPEEIRNRRTETESNFGSLSMPLQCDPTKKPPLIPVKSNIQEASKSDAMSLPLKNETSSRDRSDWPSVANLRRSAARRGNAQSKIPPTRDLISAASVRNKPTTQSRGPTGIPSLVKRSEHHINVDATARDIQKHCLDEQ